MPNGKLKSERVNKLNEITFSDILGKVILIGLTYYSIENKPVKQGQYYGTVIDADGQGIKVRLNDGTIFNLPPDLSSTRAAQPGEYHLNSTGEVVVNPDFLATWSIMLQNKDGQ